MHGVFTYIWLEFMVNVGQYHIYMEHMGNVSLYYSLVIINHVVFTIHMCRLICRIDWDKIQVYKWISGWWFQISLYFHSYLAKIPILTSIFQMGWNHQLDFHLYVKITWGAFGGRWRLSPASKVHKTDGDLGWNFSQSPKVVAGHGILKKAKPNLRTAGS